MKYKPSMFNYVFESDEELVLFNSLKGIVSASRVSRDYCEQVREMLQSREGGIEADDRDKIIASLVQKGFLVEETVDEKQRRVCRYVKKDYPFPKKTEIDRYKMFVPRNQGEGELGETLSTPIFAKPDDCCTETFIVIGGFNTESEMHNCWSYIKTKFFRTMLAMKKNDQGCGQGVYQYIPLQDFSKPWTDEELYAKYKLSPEEINFIESMIRPME